MKNIRKVAKKANCVSQMTSEWESSIVDFHLESCCFSKRKWSVCVLESKLLLLLSFLPCQLYWRYGWQTLCDLMDCGLPGSSDQVVLQARILEWVAVCHWQIKCKIFKVYNVMTWCMCTLWKDSHNLVNTSSTSNIYFSFSWWEHLSSILLVNFNCKMQCHQLVTIFLKIFK